MWQRSQSINQMMNFFAFCCCFWWWVDRKEKTIEIQRHAPLIYEEVMNRKSGWTIGFYLLSIADDRSIGLMNVIYFILAVLRELNKILKIHFPFHLKNSLTFINDFYFSNDLPTTTTLINVLFLIIFLACFKNIFNYVETRDWLNFNSVKWDESK